MRLVVMLIGMVVISVSCSTNKINHKTESYTWKNVEIVGGGFVSGIVFHPLEKDLRYARTDMGGAYRWDQKTKRWIPLTDWVSYKDNNLMGIESIALDPNNPEMLYLACGTYTAPHAPNGEILVSSNRGETFTRVKVPFKMGGNENGRGNGERMAVDPANGNIVYLGTRHAGLWKSTDAGFSWNKVESFPEVKEAIPDSIPEQQQRMWSRTMLGSGIVWIVFDPTSASERGSKTIYAGVSLMGRDNFFRSNDEGNTWHPVPNQPREYRPTQGVLASNGNLLISYGDNPGPNRMRNGAVWKYNIHNGEWTDITPDKPIPGTDKAFGYASVSVDANNPDVAIVSTFYRPWKYGSDELFRTIDGGKSWKAVFANGTQFDYSIAPYTEFTPIHWMFDIEINPFDSDHAIFTTGFGGFETFNLTQVDKGVKTNWSVYSRGIEETVPLELCSPPEGASLISAIGDYAGFVHWDLDQSVGGQYFTNPYFGNCDGITCAEMNPEMLVRVGIASAHHGGNNIGYSTDFGKSWQTSNMPTQESRHGHITVSSNGATWIWTPQREKPYFTKNKGVDWKKIEELSENMRVVADRVNPDKFYAIDLYEGLLYSSIDGAVSFNSSQLELANGLAVKGKQRGDNRGGQDRIYATPGYENDLWIAAFDGLYHSPDENSRFELIAGVSEIHGFGFGKAAPRSKYPALYLIGTVDGIRGIYRSDNKARSWVRINNDEQQWGLLLHITGDPKKYGRAYVGTHGRGVLYGDLK